VSPRRFQTSSPPLTRREIVDRAIHYADQGALDRLTIRRLADDLDVTPMALYRHVRDKDDLLEQVTDVLVARAGLPDPALDWEVCLATLAHSLRGVLRSQPAAVAAYARRPQTSAAALSRLEVGLASLHDAGFPPDKAVEAYAAVHTYTIGFCALESTRHRAAGIDDTSVADPGDHDQPEDDPVARERAAIESFVTEEQFELGLRALVRGLAQELDRGSQR
jgi:AcrR family transcriptional regulator